MPFLAFIYIIFYLKMLKKILPLLKIFCPPENFFAPLIKVEMTSLCITNLQKQHAEHNV